MAKVIGTQTFINRDTGEIVETETIQRNGDYDFHKIWLSHILEAVEEVGNKKMKVLMHLLGNIDRQNRYIGTYDSIADEVDCHRKTVGELMNSLKNANIVSQPQRGVIRVNPDVIFKGSKQKRMNVLIRYTEESDQLDMFDQNDEVTQARQVKQA